MPSFDLKIGDWLRNGQEIQNIGERLLEECKSKKLSREDHFIIAQFLLDAGLHQKLLRMAIQAFHYQQPIPWRQLAECLGINNIALDEEAVSLLFEVAGEEAWELSITRTLDGVATRFSLEREKFFKDIARTAKKEKEKYLRQRELAKAEQLFDQEREVLTKLKELCPFDPQIDGFILDFENRKASSIVSRGAKPATLEIRRVDQKNKEERAILEIIRQAGIEYCKLNSAWSLDFAHLMLFLEAPEESLEFLDFSKGQPAADWLRLEAQLRSHQYLNLLATTQELENRFANIPDALFECHYFRAQALKGLGQTRDAIALMEHIIQLRPSFRSANALLVEWHQG